IDQRAEADPQISPVHQRDAEIEPGCGAIAESDIHRKAEVFADIYLLRCISVACVLDFEGQVFDRRLIRNAPENADIGTMKPGVHQGDTPLARKALARQEAVAEQAERIAEGAARSQAAPADSQRKIKVPPTLRNDK